MIAETKPKELKDFAKLASEFIYDEYFLDGLKPDPILTVSEWADQHRILASVSSAEPGQWSTDRTPYLREIMDNLSTVSPIQEVIFMKGAQIGGTECGNNWIGYIIDHAPGPTMSVMPRIEDARKNSKIRLQPLIDACPRLKEKVKDPKARDSGNTMLQKDFPGGMLLLTGANSATGLRSVPIRYLFLDEPDAYPGDVDGEGDPIDLAKKRTDTFANKKKIFQVSTPTIENRSKIEAAYNKTDQRKYFMPCPECGHMQWLQWQQIKWEGNDPRTAPQTARYECEECKYKIENWQKTKMLAKGEWRATSESAHAKLVGYHLSGLYSPVGWLSWEDMVRAWIDANYPRNVEKLKTFINTGLGETWKDKGDAPEWEKIYNRREDYEINSVPNGVCFLTAGVDIQADRIEVEIVGWGRNKRSWSIDYRIFEGQTNTIDSEPWTQLQYLLGEVWEAKNGVDLEIKRMAVDSGYNTQIVYAWVKQFPISKVFAIKGSATQSVAINQGKPVDIRKGKRRIRNATKVFSLGVSGLKQELYGWLKTAPPKEDEQTPYGFCHFPEYGQEHFKRLTSETLETKWVKGYKQYEWVANGRNEQLDCRVYARAAASFFGIDRFKESRWVELENETCVISEGQKEETMQKSEKKRQKTIIKRRKSRFS